MRTGLLKNGISESKPTSTVLFAFYHHLYDSPEKRIPILSNQTKKHTNNTNNTPQFIDKCLLRNSLYSHHFHSLPVRRASPIFFVRYLATASDATETAAPAIHSEFDHLIW